jgi:hypothetical protein
MTATGTYAWNPAAGDIVLNAFGMLQIRRHELTAAHLDDAAFQANMLGVDISNRNPERWLYELQSITLSSSATYTLESRTISVTTAVISIPDEYDRAIGPMSAADYTVIAQKDITAPPASYWFSLTDPPTITLWPVPDDDLIAAGGLLKLMTFRQTQDVDLTNGQSIDCPYRFLDAFTTGLAARLAEYYRPEKVDRMNTYYEQRIARAIKRDQEQVPITIAPSFQGYYS